MYAILSSEILFHDISHDIKPAPNQKANYLQIPIPRKGYNVENE